MVARVIFLALVASGATGRGDPPLELDAKVWWRPPPIRVPDDRTYVVLFFTTVQEEKVAPLIRRLNRMDQRKDVVVVGLSPQEAGRVEAFIKRHNVRFAVGAGSRTHKNKRFAFKEWPHLVVVRQPIHDELVIVPLSDLSAVEALLPPPESAEPSVASGGFDENLPAEVLREHVLGDPDQSARLEALRLLREKMPPGDFMRFCDEIMDLDRGPDANDITWWGHVGYEKHLADPDVPEKQPVWAPSVKVSHEYHQTPNDPRWRAFERYVEAIDARSAQELRADFFAHLTDQPDDLLIRREIARHIGQCADTENARRILMELIPGEPDFVIRQRLVGGLMDVCEVGDVEVADFLEQRLAEEDNIRFVRPMMRYVLRYLRTGEH